MKLQETINKLTAGWTITPESRTGVLNIQKEPPYKGQCGDFAVSVIWHTFGTWGMIWAILTGRAQVYKSLYEGEWHFVGKIDRHFFDSTAWTASTSPPPKVTLVKPLPRLSLLWRTFCGGKKGSAIGLAVVAAACAATWFFL